MQKIFAALVLTLVFSSFISCKKGDDDPGFSFLTRKARLAGEWHLKKGTASYTVKNSQTVSYAYAFDGSKYQENVTSSGGPLTYYTGIYGLSLTISKNGTFKMNERFFTGVLTAEGTWNFNNGIGDAKKKENVTFFIDKVTSGSTLDDHFFNRFNVTFEYRIKELKNKEIIISSSGKSFADGNGSYTDFSTEYTFIQ